MSSLAASSSSFVSSSLAFAFPSAAFLAACEAAAVPCFLGAALRLPTLTAGPPSCASVTGPGAGRLLRLLAAVLTGVGGAGVVLARGSFSRVARMGVDGGPADSRRDEARDAEREPILAGSVAGG